MAYAKRSVEKMSDVGDQVGELLGKAVKGAVKHSISILVISVIGVIVFISSMLYRAFKSREKEEEELYEGL